MQIKFENCEVFIAKTVYNLTQTSPYLQSVNDYTQTISYLGNNRPT